MARLLMKLQKTIQSMSVEEGTAPNGEGTSQASASGSTAAGKVATKSPHRKGGPSTSGKKDNHKGPKR